MILWASPCRVADVTCVTDALTKNLPYETARYFASADRLIAGEPIPPAGHWICGLAAGQNLPTIDRIINGRTGKGTLIYSDGLL
jgi:hypothetical protein